MSLEKVASYVGEELATKIGQMVNCFACGCIDEEELKDRIEEVSDGKVTHLSLNMEHHTHNLKVQGNPFPALTIMEKDLNDTLVGGCVY